MNRTILAGLAAAAIVVLVVFLRPGGPPAPKPLPREKWPIGWTVDRTTAPEFTRPRELLLQPAQPDSRQRRLLAAGLRARARTGPAALEELIRDLRDAALPREFRELVAVVLGTIDDPRAQGALLEELGAATEAGWKSVILHALGAAKESPDDEIFDHDEAPYVYEVAGLRVEIRTEFGDEAARRTVGAFLADADLETRRAAARALIHSTAFGDVRTQFAGRMGSEPDEGIRAGYGHALAQWAAGRPLEAPERAATVDLLLAAAALPGGGALRLRVEDPLRRTAMTPEEMGRLADLALRGSVEQQIWSLSVLRGKSGSPIEEACARLAGANSPPKVREYAAGVLGGIRTAGAEETLRRLLGDPEWHVRAAAVRALRGRPSAREALERAAASDPDERVRQNARDALR